MSLFAQTLGKRLQYFGGSGFRGSGSGGSVLSRIKCLCAGITTSFKG